ncbi:unnamed protein product [Rotaria magnacalcarata]|uniref:Uncharacterized protein n=2 Tax=Rotaria magnacalcarata TaxID=392030 RepID=A0A820J962_9BILA|nr:unnamed protein product [Rotaria magnacalcarata]CAF4321204.1 unnamed protein product [Rotaria magnacalcarata]
MSTEPQHENQNQDRQRNIANSSSFQTEKTNQVLPSKIKNKKIHRNNPYSWSNKQNNNNDNSNKASFRANSSSYFQNTYSASACYSSNWQTNKGIYPDDAEDHSKSRGPPKARWLRGIAAHLQLAIVRATSDQARGEKRTGKISLSNAATITALTNIGIENKWIPCPEIVRLLDLQTTFIKGDFIKKANRLEFRQVQKKQYYFDGNNEPRHTEVAYYLSFRLLKQTPQPRTIICHQKSE